MSTNSLSVKDIKRSWHLVDAQDQILGRLASKVSQLLLGKNKAMYVPYLDTGDNVVVVNAAKIKVTGKKESVKKYYHHSQFRGGLKVKPLAEVRQEKPERIIEHAIKGMMPKTKLGRVMIKKLHVFAGINHPYQSNFKKEETKKDLVN